MEFSITVPSYEMAGMVAVLCVIVPIYAVYRAYVVEPKGWQTKVMGCIASITTILLCVNVYLTFTQYIEAYYCLVYLVFALCISYTVIGATYLWSRYAIAKRGL